MRTASLLTRLFRQELDKPTLKLIERGEIAPPPSQPPQSYEVRIRYSVGGTVCLIGHDGRGNPMMELRLARRHLSPAMLSRMASWCRAHDDPPELRLVEQ